MKKKLSRRRFLSKFAAGAAGLLILRDGQSVRGVPGNEKINVALIGVGGRGTWFVDTIPRMENVVAICDVNEQKIAETFKRWAELADRFTTSPHEWERSAAPAFRRLADEKVSVFGDFRKMFDAIEKQIDAVVVSTPDHTHAVWNTGGGADRKEPPGQEPVPDYLNWDLWLEG